MRGLLVVAMLGVFGCTTTDGYYVADVYQDGSGNLSVRKCAIQSGGKGDSPDPGDCFVVAVAPPPSRVAPPPATPPSAPEPVEQATRALAR
ncbi:MAG TPA: hypothetical protein VLX92_12415 [Kofleriaceae bacterium]|nr:hypothetical protein [Kofleriaceae bacterium]